MNDPTPPERPINLGSCLRCGRPAEPANPETGWHEITDDSDPWSEGRTTAMICPDCASRPELAIEREPPGLSVKLDGEDFSP